MVIRKLFSSNWKMREEGLIELEDRIINGRDHREEEAFVNGVGAVKLTIQDKMAGVGQKAMNFLTAICETYPRV
jgi:hypothetical protein